jgi:diguanylate cyclase (GGDEF)-like protein/PAS domain S-box-containing protein
MQDSAVQTQVPFDHPTHKSAADFQPVQGDLNLARADYEKIQTDLERAIERANAMAMKAEIANIELSQIINTSIEGMFLVDEDFTIKRINASLLRFLEIEESLAVGRKCHDVMKSSWCGTGNCPLTQLLSGRESLEMDIERKRKDGVDVPFIFSATPFRGIDGSVIGMVARFKDITERKEAEKMLKEANERLERLSTRDGLTQIANRRSFDQMLDKEWSRLCRSREPLSMIMCDVDFFKLFNDTYGHQGGDDCLKTVAKALETVCRRGGDFVARYGGEEFVIILPATFEKGALRVAEKIRRHLEKLAISHPRSQVASHVTLSMGVATLVPSERVSPQQLVKWADQALYRAKASGRNRVATWLNE